MRIFALTSATGGAGRTTLAAALGNAIARLDIPVLVIDLDPANYIGMMLGAGRGPAEGVGNAILEGRNIADYALITADDVRLIGFGQSTAASRLAIDQRLAAEPGWLAKQLAMIDLPPETIVLCDTPRRPSLLAEEACRAAACVVDVLAPTPLSYAGLLGLPPACSLLHVLNGFDATRALHSDLHALLADELGEALAPFAVHRDEAIAEALAADTSVLDFARTSQGVRDVLALARWLVKEWQAT